MDNVKKFYEALANDKAMQERASALNKENEKPDDAAASAAIVTFAQAEGFSFTEADLNAYTKQAKPLADDSLDAVAGGTAGCGCALGGGGGGTDSNGDTVGCACALVGVGTNKHGDYICECLGAGAGWA